MNLTKNDRGALRNRLYGLLIIAAVPIVFWFWPPMRDSQHQRGAMDLLKDFGMGDVAFKIRLAVHWGIGIAVVLLGGYQVITGERIRRPDW